VSCHADLPAEVIEESEVADPEGITRRPGGHDELADPFVPVEEGHLVGLAGSYPVLGHDAATVFVHLDAHVGQAQ
jgi:hypothetical protein